MIGKVKPSKTGVGSEILFRKLRLESESLSISPEPPRQSGGPSQEKNTPPLPRAAGEVSGVTGRLNLVFLLTAAPLYAVFGKNNWATGRLQTWRDWLIASQGTKAWPKAGSKSPVRLPKVVGRQYGFASPVSRKPKAAALTKKVTK